MFKEPIEKASGEPPEFTDVSHTENEHMVTELGSYSLNMQLFFLDVSKKFLFPFDL